MPTRRQQRLNELLLEELSMLVAGNVDDPRLAGVVITRVETTRDLSTAKVFFTGGVEGQATADTQAALAHASSFFRHQLGYLGLRRLPALVFARDRQFESGERVLDILAALKSESVDLDTAGQEPRPPEASPERDSGGADGGSGGEPDEEAGAPRHKPDTSAGRDPSSSSNDRRER